MTVVQAVLSNRHYGNRQYATNPLQYKYSPWASVARPLCGSPMCTGPGCHAHSQPQEKVHGAQIGPQIGTETPQCNPKAKMVPNWLSHLCLIGNENVNRFICMYIVLYFFTFFIFYDPKPQKSGLGLASSSICVCTCIHVCICARTYIHDNFMSVVRSLGTPSLSLSLSSSCKHAWTSLLPGHALCYST